MQSRIEQQVMAGVGAIYVARQLTSRVALECYALAAAAIALWQLTWVHKVFANFAVVERGGLASIAQYVGYAFLHTHVATQAALLAAAIASIALIIDAVRSLHASRVRLA